jgi:sugar fermentation stimulation protein A
LALFPDTVTERGQKHLIELVGVLSEARAVLLPCISRDDVDAFAPGDSADPRYGELFHQAIEAGVEVLPCQFRFRPDAVLFERVLPVQQRQAG